MTRKETQAQWEAARELAVRHVDTTYHLSADAVREANPRLPFLFTAALPGKDAILVHRGSVLETGGPEALGAYLDSVDVYADRALTTADVSELIHLFEVFPPVDARAGSPRSYVTEEGTDLSMRATWSDHGLSFTLAYRLQSTSDPDIDPGESDDDTRVMTISLWTLHLRKGAVPSWTEERREKTYQAERFDDE